MLLEWYILVPIGDEGNLRRATTDAELRVPPRYESADPCNPLAATRITKPAHATHDGIFKCLAVVPPIVEYSTRRTLQRLTETESRVAHGNDDHSAVESLPPRVGLHGHPAATS